MRTHHYKVLVVLAFTIGFAVLTVLFKYAVDSITTKNDADMMCHNSIPHMPFIYEQNPVCPQPVK